LKAIGNSSKAKHKVQWSALTDDDLDTIAGERDQLSGKIQDFYGVSKDAAAERVNDFETPGCMNLESPLGDP
jgi:uncharacterized protein YjbJ (UPF0337 family)